MFELTTTMMKRSNFLILLTLVFASVSFVQCGSDSSKPPDPKDQQITALSKNWYAKSVKLNGTDAPGYVGANPAASFQIKITGTTGNYGTIPYQTTNRPAGVQGPWPGSGNFSLGSNSTFADFATVLTRKEDNLLISYSVTSTELQMTFNYTGSGFTGRTSVVQGNWSFTFAPVTP